MNSLCFSFFCTERKCVKSSFGGGFLNDWAVENGVKSPYNRKN